MSELRDLQAALRASASRLEKVERALSQAAGELEVASELLTSRGLPVMGAIYAASARAVRETLGEASRG